MDLVHELPDYNKPEKSSGGETPENWDDGFNLFSNL